MGRAYIAGFKWALEHGYEFVFELDGDFSHNPDDIPMFLEAARDADLVLGSRYVNGIRIINWPLSRLMLSKSAASYVQIITGMPITDPTGGYKCFSRRALQAINLDEIESNGYSFQIEMTHNVWRQGMKIVEVPIVFTDRVPGPFQDVRAHRPGSAWYGVAALVPEQDAPPACRADRKPAVPPCARTLAAAGRQLGHPDDARALLGTANRTASPSAGALTEVGLECSL